MAKFALASKEMTTRWSCPGTEPGGRPVSISKASSLAEAFAVGALDLEGELVALIGLVPGDVDAEGDPEAMLDGQAAEAQHVPAAAHRVDLPVEDLAVVGEDEKADVHGYFGGIRSAPSRRIVSPLSIGLATIAATMSAYSEG